MRRFGSVLMLAGIGIWGLGIVAWIQSIWVTMPPDTVKVIVLTLAALAGGVLLAAGAATSRAARIMNNREMRLEKADTQSGLPNPAPTGVGQTTRLKDSAAITNARKSTGS